MTKSYIVGITGGSASGKTSLLKEIRKRFNSDEVCILSQDNYYKPVTEQQTDENGHVNFDLPDCINLNEFKSDIEKLASGNTIKRQEYRFQHEVQLGDWITYNPAPIIIVEGLFIFYREDIYSQFDLKIFIDAQENLQLERRIKRDTVERNIPEDFVHYQWNNHVMPAYKKYLEPYKSQADIIINNNSHFNNSLKVIENHFKWHIQSLQQHN
ncbi:MAG: uridine-cytidine kinase [Bacteroidia bacterium]|nr:uridine-cytidine kinase [Bacteroidia bacterium]